MELSIGIISAQIQPKTCLKLCATFRLIFQCVWNIKAVCNVYKTCEHKWVSYSMGLFLLELD